MPLFSFTGKLIANGKALYIDSSAGLLALDAGNGHVLWQQAEGSLILGEPTSSGLKLPFTGKGNPGNSFFVGGNTVVRMGMTLKGNFLTRLDASNGVVLSRQHVEDFYVSWSGTELKTVAASVPRLVGFGQLEGLMTGTTSYVFPSVGELDALDNQTGKHLWSLKLLEKAPALLTIL